MAAFPLVTENQARYLNSVIPITIVLFAGAGALLLFEQNEDQGEDLGIAVANVLLGLSVFTSATSLVFTYTLLQVFSEREVLPITRAVEEGHRRGEGLVWLTIHLQYLSFESLASAIVGLFIAPGPSHRGSYWFGIAMGICTGVVTLYLLSFRTFLRVCHAVQGILANLGSFWEDTCILFGQWAGAMGV